MRDDEGRIDFSTLDAFEERGHVLVHVRLPHLERQALRERGAERKLVEPSAVDPRNRDDAALAARPNRLAQRVRPIGRQVHRRFGPIVPGVERRAVRLESDGVDARVGSLPACQLAQRIGNIDLRVVQRLGLAVRRRQRRDAPEIDRSQSRARLPADRHSGLRIAPPGRIPRPRPCRPA